MTAYNPDKIAKLSMFENTDKLLIHSIFLTHQGEGPYTGRLAVFVRLGGCNRADKDNSGCYFCDTAFQMANSKWMSVEQVASTLDSIDPNRNAMLVVTGGEPGLQWKNVLELIHSSVGRSIQIESNGDFEMNYHPIDDDIDFVISPKYVVHKEAPAHVMMMAGRFGMSRLTLKFLVSADETSQYYSLPEWWQDDDLDDIWVSPITVYKSQPEKNVSFFSPCIDLQATRANMARAVKLAVENGLNLSVQNHLIAGIE